LLEILPQRHENQRYDGPSARRWGFRSHRPKTSVRPLTINE
jgi:hypothetical protein